MHFDYGRLIQQTSAIVVACVCMATTGIAYGEVIFGNLDTPRNGLETSYYGWPAQSFVVGSHDMILESLDFRTVPTVGGGGGIILTLYSNDVALSQPDSPLERIEGLMEGGLGPFHYTASAESILHANTAYWIVFSASGVGSAVAAESGFRQPEIGSEIGLMYTTNSGATWTPFNYLINMQVNGSPVPEPSSLLLLGFFGLCFAAYTGVVRAREARS